MKKKGNEIERPFFSEKIGYFLSEFTPAIPRILIAVILGVVISIPLELKLFEKEVNEQADSVMRRAISDEEEDKRKHIKKEAENSWKESMQRIQQLEDRKTQIKESLGTQFDDYKDSVRMLGAEVKGTGGSGIPGVGLVAKTTKKMVEDIKNAYDAERRRTKEKLESIDSRITDEMKEQKRDQQRYRKRVEKIEEKIKTREANMDEEDNLGVDAGFLTRVKAL